MSCKPESTHHMACDCREEQHAARVRELETALRPFAEIGTSPDRSFDYYTPAARFYPEITHAKVAAARAALGLSPAAKPTPPPAVEPARCTCGKCEYCVYGTSPAPAIAADVRRAANWTPPKDNVWSFLSEAEGSETCMHCGRHVSHHYGGTEYRCIPRRDDLSPAPAESAGSIKLDSKLAPADPYEGRKVGEVLHEMMTDPAHATSRGACERCGGAGTVQEPRYHASGKMLGVVFVPCPAKCSPPAAAKDEQPRREAIEECRQVCLDRARRCRADGETAYANAYEMAADLIGGLLDTPAAAKDDRVRTPSVEEIDKACRDHDDAIRAQARREMNEACARFVEAGAELNRIPMWMVREKLAEGIRALLDTPAAPTLDFVGPCVHGRDPYDRCEGCGMLTPEQARAVAEAEDFR